MTGKKFGRLQIIEFAYTKNGNAYWLCKCDCGNTKAVNGINIRRGDSRSCGCLHNNINIIHGATANGHTERLYRIWIHIRHRCNSPKNKAYNYYGGKGVSVCDEWDDYLVFKEWSLSNGYEDDLTIDRIDSDGDYSPENCQWITQSENSTKMNEERRNKNACQQII